MSRIINLHKNVVMLLTFYNRFLALCKQKKMSPSAVTRELGLNNSISTSWKRGAFPTSNTLQKLADYFGITIDDLLGLKPLADKEVEVDFGFKKEKAVKSGGAIELDAFDDFLTAIGFKSYIDPTRFKNPEGKAGDVWIIEDTRENKFYTAKTEDLDRLKDSVLSFSKFQVYELLHNLKQIEEDQIGHYGEDNG